MAALKQGPVSVLFEPPTKAINGNSWDVVNMQLHTPVHHFRIFLEWKTSIHWLVRQDDKKSVDGYIFWWCLSLVWLFYSNHFNSFYLQPTLTLIYWSEDVLSNRGIWKPVSTCSWCAPIDMHVWYKYMPYIIELKTLEDSQLVLKWGDLAAFCAPSQQQFNHPRILKSVA